MEDWGQWGMWQATTRRTKRLWDVWRDESGNALVEAAIVVPVALMVLAGGFELSRGISYHHAADKAVRDAARYIARLPSGLAYDTARAQNLVTYGCWSTSACGQSVLSPGTVSQLRFPQARFDDGFVRLEADVQYSFPLLSLILPNPTLVFTVTHEQPYIGE
jgi:hypothetical protein